LQTRSQVLTVSGLGTCLLCSLLSLSHNNVIGSASPHHLDPTRRWCCSSARRPAPSDLPAAVSIACGCPRGIPDLDTLQERLATFDTAAVPLAQRGYTRSVSLATRAFSVDSTSRRRAGWLAGSSALSLSCSPLKLRWRGWMYEPGRSVCMFCVISGGATRQAG
jgi:hypothetical protein